VAGGVNRRQQEKYAAQDAQAQQGAAPAPAEAAAPSSDDMINQLKELAGLKDQGILTEDEFNAQKAKILAEMG
jgi:membrane protease subunit (stomatin/prohibitin family)